jgi:hypothetical protein
MLEVYNNRCPQNSGRNYSCDNKYWLVECRGSLNGNFFLLFGKEQCMGAVASISLLVDSKQREVNPFVIALSMQNICKV